MFPCGLHFNSTAPRRVVLVPAWEILHTERDISNDNGPGWDVEFCGRGWVEWGVM